MSGLIIKKLRVVGSKVPDAEIKFEKGLNVVHGPSDSGKTYILQCLNYILGGSEPPKKVKESEKYEKILLEVKSNELTFTLVRGVGKNNRIQLFKEAMSNIENSKPVDLKTQHDAQSDDNISKFLLNKIGLRDTKWLKKNQRNDKSTLSFREFKHLMVINEEKVISEKSPLHSDILINATKEKSLIKLLLTGEDDRELETYEKPEISKAKITAKIEVLNDLISANEANYKKISSLSYKDNIEEILTEFKSKLMSVNSQIDKTNYQRKIIGDEIKALELKLRNVNKLLERFNLLEEQYEKDIERLSFIQEGSFYFSQLNETNCPYCGQELKHDNDCKRDRVIDPATVLQSSNAEISKIKLNIKNLIHSKSDLQEEKKELNQQINESKIEYESLENVILDEYAPQAERLQSQIDEIIEDYRVKSKEEALEIELNNLNLKLDYYKRKIEDVSTTDKELFENAEDILKNSSFLEFYKNTLLEWGFDNQEADVQVIKKRQFIDFQIGGKERSSYGKGYRALFNSAFVISLVKYCYENNISHPNFVIIDSPVTTFKESNKANNDVTIVPQSIQDNFFENLATLVNHQVIILENKEPSEKVKNSINFINFTKDLNGRYGFFPK